MRWINLGAASLMTLAVGACASGGAGPEVASVVQDEQARQAAAVSADNGESARDALRAGQAASTQAPDEPPYL